MGIQQMIMAAGGLDEFFVANSLRFNDDDSAYLNWTPSGAGSTATWTLSFWIKRGNLGFNQYLVAAKDSSNYFELLLNSSDKLAIYNYIGSGAALSITNRVFQDCSVFYHIVYTYDTSQSGNDKIKLYVNGTQETNFSTDNRSSTGASYWNTATVHTIGSSTTPHYPFDGYIADLHFVDGTALDASSFGETVDGSWVPKEFSDSHGTNGYYLKFNNTSDLGEDSAGSNDWTANNLVGSVTGSLPCVEFDGSGDYLSLANSTDFALGAPSNNDNDFTVECFFLSPDTQESTNDCLVDARASNSAIPWMMGRGARGRLRVFDGSEYYSDGGTYASGSGSLTNGWNHVAWVRSGTTHYLFENGRLGYSFTSSTNLGTSATPLRVGVLANNSSEPFNGFISNLRIIKGTALYTATFTVPTTPLTNVTNTKLLCCQSNSSATTDNSDSSHTITANGDAAATTKSDDATTLDLLSDSPSTYDDGGNGVGNYCTLNPLAANSNYTLSDGNLYVDGYASYSSVYGTMAMPSSGKWYFECNITANAIPGITLASAADPDEYVGQVSESYGFDATNGNFHNGGGAGSGTSASAGDIVSVAYDADGGNLKFYINNVSASSGNAFTSIPSGNYLPAFRNGNSEDITVNFGARSFAYTPPTGYLALNSYNT